MRILLVLMLILLPGAGMAQQSDKDFLTTYLEENLSDAGRVVTITGFAGALSSRATMVAMTIADDQGIWLTLKGVTLDWSRSALLSGQIEIQEFSVDEIDLQRIPATNGAGMPAAEARGFALPNLPVSINIGGIAARHIVLGAAVLGQPVEGRLTAEAQLAGGEGSARLVLERTDAGPKGLFSVEASYANASGQLVLALTAAEDAGGVAVNLLGVPGAPSAELTIAGSGPISDFAADVSLQTDGVTRLAGKVALTGDADGQGFTADLAGDPTPVFLPRYAEFFGPQVRLQASGRRLADGRMELSRLTVQAQALTLDGTLSIDAQGVPEAFALTGKLGLPDGPVVLPLLTERETRLNRADLTLSYDRATGDVWQGRAVVEGLDHAAFTAATMTLSGSGHIAREAGGPMFDGNIIFGAAGLAMTDPGLAQALGTTVDGQADLAWQQGDTRLAVSNLSLKGAGYRVSTTGGIGGLSDGFALKGTAQGQYDDLSRLGALAGRPLAGLLSFDLSGEGSPLSGFFDVDGSLTGQDLVTGVTQLDGLLHGDSAITLSVRRDVTGTNVKALTLTTGTLTAKAQGRITSDGNLLTADLDFRDISVLGPSYHGALKGSANLAGSFEAGSFSLEAVADDLAIGQDQADRLLRGQSKLSLTLTLDKGTAMIDRALISTPQLTLDATGRAAAAGSDITAKVTLADLSVLGGGYLGALQGQAQFTGKPDDGRLVVTAAASNLGIGKTMLDTLLRGQSRLMLDLALTAEGVRVNRANLANPQVTAEASTTVGGVAGQLDLQARLADLGQLFPQFPGVLTATGKAIPSGDGYQIDLIAKGPADINASVKGRMAGDFASADLAIAGTATAALANKLAAPRSLSGPVRFDLRLLGPLSLASLNGPVTISGGRLADPAQNFAVQDISGSAQLAGGRAQVAGDAAVSTGGRIEFRGSVGLEAPYTADMSVTLQSVVLRDPDLYTTVVNGALTFKGPSRGGALIAGSVSLGRTELRIPSTGLGADGDLPGLEHAHEPAEVRATRLRAGLLATGGASGSGSAGHALNLRISAPNQVFIRGRGLDGELGGSLTLRGTTEAIAPTGAFNLIRGRLDILGRRLDLSEALLQLQGALVPYVRILASVESDGITASVLIEGPANDPLVTFTSSPDLPQEEVIARLLFDRGLENLTAFQAIQLAGAVATLAGRGGDGVIGNLRRKAGLDNLDVKTDAVGNTAVTLGKYLSDKIYTEVTVDQGGKSAISLNLDVASHITLKGHVDSDGQTGIGVFLQKDY